MVVWCTSIISDTRVSPEGEPLDAESGESWVKLPSGLEREREREHPL